MKFGSTYTKILYAHGYPRNVEMGFLDKVVSLQGDFDLSLYIEPYDLELTMIMLNKELQKQRADLYSAQTKGILNPSLEIKYADTKAILENLQKGKEKLFNVSLYINCRASTKKYKVYHAQKYMNRRAFLTKSTLGAATLALRGYAQTDEDALRFIDKNGVEKGSREFNEHREALSRLEDVVTINYSNFSDLSVAVLTPEGTYTLNSRCVDDSTLNHKHNAFLMMRGDAFQIVTLSDGNTEEINWVDLYKRSPDQASQLVKLSEASKEISKNTGVLKYTFVGARSPTFSPNDKRVCFIVNLGIEGSLSQTQVFECDLETHEGYPLCNALENSAGGDGIERCSYSPTSDKILVEIGTGDQTHIALIDKSKERILNVPESNSFNLSSAYDSFISYQKRFSWLPDGKRFAITQNIFDRIGRSNGINDAIIRIIDAESLKEVLSLQHFPFYSQVSSDLTKVIYMEYGSNDLHNRQKQLCYLELPQSSGIVRFSEVVANRKVLIDETDRRFMNKDKFGEWQLGEFCWASNNRHFYFKKRNVFVADTLTKNFLEIGPKKLPFDRGQGIHYTVQYI